MTNSDNRCGGSKDLYSDQRMLDELGNFGRWLETVAGNTQPRDLHEVLDTTEQRYLRATNRLNSIQEVFQSIGSVLRTHIEEMMDESHQKKRPGISTGFQSIDAATQGLKQGNLTILAGAPSTTRTKFLLRVMLCASVAQRIPAAFFSMGTGERYISSLLLELIAKPQRLEPNERRPHDEDHAFNVDSISRFDDAPLYIDHSPALGVLDIRARSRHLLKREHGLGLIAIGSLSLIPAFDDEIYAMAMNIQALKLLAKELNCHVMVLGDLVRPAEYGMSPTMTDLGTLGITEKDAELVMLFCEENGGQSCGLNIAKNLFGPTGMHDLGNSLVWPII